MDVRGIFKFFLHCHGIVAAVLLVISIWMNHAVVHSTNFFSQPKGYNATYQLSPPFFKLITAGYWTAAVDYLWIESLAEIGKGVYTTETQDRSRQYYRLATALDPDFYELYDQAGVLFSFFYDSGPDATEFLSAGIRHFESGQAPAKFWTHPCSLYLYSAYAHAYLNHDWTAAKKAYLQAAALPGSPFYLQQMKVWLEKEGSEKVLAVRVLKFLIQNTPDEKIRKKYEERLKQYEP